MLFENATLDIAQLPKVEENNFVLLDKNYLTVSLIGNGIFLAIILMVSIVVFFATGWHTDWRWITLDIVLWLLISAFSLWLETKGFSQKGYVIREKDIAFKKGVFWRSVTTVPFHRIQHCGVSQGPIERSFSLARLRVYTAGGERSDLQIPGLPPEKAHELKSFILENSK